MRRTPTPPPVDAAPWVRARWADTASTLRSSATQRLMLRSLLAGACLCLIAPKLQLEAQSPSQTASRPHTADDLARFFTEWRDFQKPKLVDGVPDYSPAAMTAQARAATALRRRLAAFDTSGWSVAQQVDYHVIRAEMNGLDFDHRVLRPWANNPAFYVTVFSEQSDQPAREGPFAAGAVELWKYRYPLAPADAQAVEEGDAGHSRAARPGAREPGRATSATCGRTASARSVTSPRSWPTSKSSSPASPRRSARPPSGRAPPRDSFATWLESRAGTKTGASGVGIGNYNWYLKNVMLVPYTWSDEVLIMQRELARAHAFLALEELRNAKLPPQQPVASAAEFDARFGAAVPEYLGYLREHDLMTIQPWMDAALRARLGRFSPGAREFFTEVDYRDPVVMRTHGYHWIDLGYMEHEPNPDPVRRGPLLYNIFITRTEGHATGWEEQCSRPECSTPDRARAS